VFKSDYTLQLKEASYGSGNSEPRARGWRVLEKSCVSGEQRLTNCPGGSGGTVES